MNDPLETAVEWHAGGRRLALATVVETWGSAPRPAGSVMVCDESGGFAGSVSGGCVEVAVIEAAGDVMRTGASRLLEFGVSDEQAWAVGLACGGRIRVLIERPRPAVLEGLLAARRASRPIVLASALEGDERSLIEPSGVTPAPGASLATAAAEALRTDVARRVDIDGREWLVTPFNPPLRLVIVGAVHIAEALCAMARIAGHDVTVIDPRSAFLRPALFGGATLVGDWPQLALLKLKIDARCAAVLLTHDPKIDDPALEHLLASPAYYIGALGSRRTHARRLERLRAAGHPEEMLARIQGPAGLDIGARTPAEIALSVLAQLTASLRLVGGR